MLLAAGSAITITPNTVGLIVGAIVVIVGALYVGRSNGKQIAQDKAAKAEHDRTTTLEAMVGDLEKARKLDNDECNRKLEGQERKHNDAIRLLTERTSHLQGQLDTVKGGIVQEVGRELAAGLDQAGENVANTVSARIIEHLGDRP